jgi:hypothetical protein
MHRTWRQVAYDVVIERPLDSWDTMTFGLVTLFRTNVRTETRTRTEPFTAVVFVEELTYEAQYTHVVELTVTDERTIIWDFTAKLPINYHDDFDRPKAGRSAGPWREVSRKLIRQWDEEV